MVKNTTYNEGRFYCIFFSLILGLVFHFLKIYLDKVLIRQKEKYQIFLKSNESQTKWKYNVEKAKVENLEVYNKWLGFGKWFCVLLGIFALIRSTFPEYFE